MKMIGNVSDWLSYAGGALIKVADSAGSTVLLHIFHGYMSYIMRKLDFCLCENKGADQLCSISAFVFATGIVQFLFFLNPKLLAYS